MKHNNIRNRQAKSNQQTSMDANRKAILQLSLTTALLLAAWEAHADSPITDLGTMGGRDATFQGVSANGTVIINLAETANGEYHAFKYTADKGMVALGTLGGTGTNPFAVSADGSTIVGISSLSNNEVHAFKYTDEGGIIDLGTLGGGTYSNATKVSSDGAVIIGSSDLAAGGSHAYKYTLDDGMKDLGTLGGKNSVAADMSANGAVIVGFSDNDKLVSQAFKYTDTDGMKPLGSLAGPDGFSQAHAISSNGKIIVGQSINQDGEFHAFKLTDGGVMQDLGALNGLESRAFGTSVDGAVVVGSIKMADRVDHVFKHTESGGMKDLGTLGGTNAYLSGLSADGTVIAGNSNTANGETHGFRHTDDGGMVDLGTLGGSNSNAFALSADGRVIVGSADTANGETHAALWKNDIIVDSTNTRTALTQTAQQATQVLDMRSAQLQMLMQQDCSVGAGDGRFCIGAGATYSGTGNARSTAASITLGYQINPQWRIGTTINQSLDSSLPSEYKSSNNLPGIGAFSTFNARKDGLGWQARVAAAYQTSKVDINRKQLSHTEGGVGRADLDGKAVAIEASYRILANNNVVVAPYAALRYSSVSRSAYSESNELAFVGRYAEMGRSATSIEAGLRVGKTINSKLNLSADIGVTRDISVNNRGFKVAMDYVGGFALGNGEDQRNRAHLGLQGSYALAKDSAIQGGIYWAQQAYGNSTTSAQLRVIRQF